MSLSNGPWQSRQSVSVGPPTGAETCTPAIAAGRDPAGSLQPASPTIRAKISRSARDRRCENSKCMAACRGGEPM